MKTRCEEREGASVARKMTRRSFLKRGGIGAGAVAALQVLAAGTDASKGKRLATVIDLQKCTGCGGCILTCKNENNVQHGVAWSEAPEESSGTEDVGPAESPGTSGVEAPAGANKMNAAANGSGARASNAKTVKVAGTSSVGAPMGKGR